MRFTMKLFFVLFVVCASRDGRHSRDGSDRDAKSLDDSAVGHRIMVRYLKKALKKEKELAVGRHYFERQVGTKYCTNGYKEEKDCSSNPPKYWGSQCCIDGTNKYDSKYPGYTKIYTTGRCATFYSPPLTNSGYKNNYPSCFKHCSDDAACAYASIYDSGETCVFTKKNECVEKHKTSAAVWEKDKIESRLSHALKRTKAKIELRLSQLHRLKRRESKIGHRLNSAEFSEDHDESSVSDTAAPPPPGPIPTPGPPPPAPPPCDGGIWNSATQMWDCPPPPASPLAPEYSPSPGYEMPPPEYPPRPPYNN